MAEISEKNFQIKQWRETRMAVVVFLILISIELLFNFIDTYNISTVKA